ncbi:MAG: hypothetical protein ACLUTA_15065 [Blautia wexlerae]
MNRKIHVHFFPDLPAILMGHSMGSLAVRAYVCEHWLCTVDGHADCVRFSSNNPARPLGVAVARMEKAVLGPRHRSWLIEGLSFGTGVMRFRKR